MRKHRVFVTTFATLFALGVIGVGPVNLNLFLSEITLPKWR
jgi:hypothetical protein